MNTHPQRYSRPTDAELRQRRLEITDPYDQPNLTNHIPEGVQPIRVLNVYILAGWPAEKAYCAKCEAKRHKHGFTVELDDGTSALLGSACGEQLWGESWKEVAATFKVERERTGTILGFA